MKPDDELCLCFHITRRKVTNYLRIEKPTTPSQLSECGGAGTGCGWCRPYLEKLFKANAEGNAKPPELPDANAYTAGRTVHLKQSKGKK